MKNKLLLFLPLFIAPMLGGCSSSAPTDITYGTYKDDGARQLSSSEFSTRFESGENMLLTIYPKDSTCICWRTFSPIIDEVVSDNHLLIYKFFAEDVDDNASMKRVGGFNNRNDAPTFYILNNGRIAKYYNFSSTLDFFKKKDAFLEEINKQIIAPHMFYLDEDQLNEKINSDHSVIYFARYNCSDCNTVTPKALLPYFKEHDKTLYVFDIEVYKNEGAEKYQEIKDIYLLSDINNPNLGYGNGVVPTFQVYEKGELKDMCIFFNEGEVTYNEENDCFYALNAYYNETRLSYFHYLDNVEHKDLTKVKIEDKDTYLIKEKRYWDNNASFSYYNEILTSFLDTYL